MEISLEKIELVKDRTGVSYKEAKDALEQTEGDVVNAIILIEETIDEPSELGDTRFKETIDYIKGLISRGNVSRIVVKNGERVVLNISLNSGIIGALAFPWAALTGAIVALGTDCSVELLCNDGGVIDISSKVAEIYKDIKAKGGVVLEEIVDKSSELLKTAKAKAEELYQNSKDSSRDAAVEVKKLAASDSDASSDSDLDLSDMEEVNTTEED